MRTLQFWIDACERCVKTGAQTAVGLIAADQGGIVDIHWPQVLSIVALAMLVSMLTSVASSQVGTQETASLVD